MTKRNDVTRKEILRIGPILELRRAKEGALVILIMPPDYWRPAFLAETARIIAPHTHANCEVVVADDGSSPSTFRGALEEVLRRPILRHVQAVPEGIPKAKNAGVHESGGALILLLDEGGFLVPNTPEVRFGASSRQSVLA